jgi:hypothetical protein
VCECVCVCVCVLYIHVMYYTHYIHIHIHTHTHTHIHIYMFIDIVCVCVCVCVCVSVCVCVHMSMIHLSYTLEESGIERARGQVCVCLEEVDHLEITHKHRLHLHNIYMCMYVHTCYVLTISPIPSSRCKRFVVLRSNIFLLRKRANPSPPPCNDLRILFFKIYEVITS